VRYVDKQFLSDSYGETGHIVVQFSSPLLEEYREGNYSRYVDGDISIADCSKTICLDFTFRDEKEMKKRLKKIDKMIEVLQHARQIIPQLLEDLNGTAAEFEEEKKKEKENE
jgi:hypothetical protein